MGRKKKEEGSHLALAKQKFDIKETKKKLEEYDQKRTSSKAKSESFNITAEKYRIFTQKAIEQKGKYCTKAWDDPKQLENALMEYQLFILDEKMYPTVENVCIWLGISKETYYSILNVGDERTPVLKQFRLWLEDFSAQMIAGTEGNPGGNIYLDKSRMGFTDQPLEKTLNLNIGGGGMMPISITDDFAGGFPIDAEFEEIDETGEENESL